METTTLIISIFLVILNAVLVPWGIIYSEDWRVIGWALAIIDTTGVLTDLQIG